MPPTGRAAACALPGGGRAHGRAGSWPRGSNGPPAGYAALQCVARDFGVAVILVNHLTKDSRPQWQAVSLRRGSCSCLRCDDVGMSFGGQIRSAVASDAAEVARIYVVSWNEGFGHLLGTREPSPADAERWTGELTSARARWWVAEADRRVAGFAGICPSRDPVTADVGELDTIAVDPRDWHAGVGRALMTVALNALRSTGYAEAIAWTPAGYQRGHGFYEATGWLPDGGRRDGGRQVSFPHPLTTASMRPDQSPGHDRC